MFGIGFTELVVIVLVGIVFIRPDDLPAFFRKVGKIVAEIRGAYNEVVAVKDEFLREIDISAAEDAAQIESPDSKDGDDAEAPPEAEKPSEPQEPQEDASKPT